MIKRKLKFSVFGFLVLLLVFLPVGSVFAGIGLPHAFHGTIKYMDGTPVEAGKVISAKVAGIEYGSYTIHEAGQYGDPTANDYLVVQGDIEDGATIDFYVGGQKAEQTFPFHSGWTTELNLTVSYYTLTVTRDPTEGGTVTLYPEQLHYEAGTSVELTATPNAGYAFGSWSGDLTGSTNPDTIVMNSNKSVTAHFVLSPPPPTYYTLTVTCDPTEGGSVTLDPTQPPGGYEADTTVELTAIANEAYAFGSWSGDLTGSTNPDTIAMNSDKEVTANFVLFSAPANVDVRAADPGVDSIDVSTKDLGEVDITDMPEIVEAQEAYVVDSTGTGSFTLRFTDIANASNIVIYKVVDSTWTEIPITAITVIDPTTVEVTMEVGDPILVFGLPTGVPPPPPFDLWSYDEDGSGYIEIGELLQAINDYIAGEITISQLLEVINVYMWDAWSYDNDSSGYIEISELCDAIDGYIGNEISINQLMEVINLYISHTPKS